VLLAHGTFGGTISGDSRGGGSILDGNPRGRLSRAVSILGFSLVFAILGGIGHGGDEGGAESSEWGQKWRAGEELKQVLES